MGWKIWKPDIMVWKIKKMNQIEMEWRIDKMIKIDKIDWKIDKIDKRNQMVLEIREIGNADWRIDKMIQIDWELVKGLKLIGNLTKVFR